MNRNDLRKVAELRIRDAEALITLKRYSAAYYLAGYAVECGLKACIANTLKRFEVPDRNFGQVFYTHDFETLARRAQLITQSGIRIDDLRLKLREREIFANWRVCCQWKEESRYFARTRRSALDLYEAISDENQGVLTWLRTQW